MNWMRTVSLMILLSVLVVLAGGLVGGMGGLITALIFAGVMNFVAYWFSDKMALAMSGAKPVSEKEEPRLHRMVADVVQRAELPMPRVYLIKNDSPNAFATGRNPKHSVVAVTTGLQSILSEDELRGVIAHEMGHIKNRDMLVMTIVAMLAATITFLATMAQWSLIFGGMGGRDRDRGGGMMGIVAMLALIILMPLAATMVRMAISRTREYGADEMGARIMGNPMPLARALEKLDAAVHRKALPATAKNEAMAHLYIVNPLGAREQHAKESGGGFVNMFSTHPPIRERVRRLQEMTF
ncbi:MAG: protease HtpX [Dehalococcoidia bacterium]|nr:protease HtpX [Dehalococcoidia bacterium]